MEDLIAEMAARCANAEAEAGRLRAQNEELVKALKIAKKDFAHFQETGKLWLYPTLEAIDQALKSSEPK